jgi:hypothetical protein
MNSLAPKMERSTWVSAAKLRIASAPRIADVAFDQLDVGPFEVRRVARVRQLVEHDDVLAGRGEPPRAVGADEPGAAGDEDAHRSKPRAAVFGVHERTASPREPRPVDETSHIRCS